MNTNKLIIIQEETYKIIGCAMEVLIRLGMVAEKAYENALCIEFVEKVFWQQPRYDIHKTVKVGLLIPDLIVFNQIIVDTKTIDQITYHEKGQILNYLRITKLRVGLVLNFKHARLDWKRCVL